MKHTLIPILFVFLSACGDDDAPLPCACELGGELVICGDSSCSEGTEYLCELSGLAPIGVCGGTDAGALDAGNDAGFLSRCSETCGEGQVCAGERCVDFEAHLTGAWFPTDLDATHDVVAVGRASGLLALGGLEVQAGPGAVVVWNVTRGWTWEIVTESDVLPTSVASSERAVAVVGSHESPFSFAGSDFTQRGDPTAFVLEFTADGLPTSAFAFSGTRNYDPPFFGAVGYADEEPLQALVESSGTSIRGVIRRGAFGGREEGRWLNYAGYPEGMILDEVQLVGPNVWTAGRFAYRSIEHNDTELNWDIDRRFGPRDGAFAVAFDAATGAPTGEVLGVVDVQVNSEFVGFARTGTTTAALFLRRALSGFEPTRTQIQTIGDDGTRASFQIDGFVPLAADAADGRISVYGLAGTELSVGEERFDCASCNSDLAIVSMALDGSGARLERVVTAASERIGTRVGAAASGAAHMVVAYDADESAGDRLFEGQVAIVSLSAR